MKIALTGATGFVGQYVVSEMERHKVSPILICQSKGKISPPLLKHSIVLMNLKTAPANAFDLLGQPDTLIHLAWAGLPNYKSLHHFEEELPAHYRFLKNLVDSGLENLVVAGTCFEYGMQSGPLSEDLEARPNNPYGFAKNVLRCQLEYLQQVRPFNLTWARLFYLYGEGQTENSLIPQLKRAVEQGHRVFNMSGGEQLRDYLPVTKVANYLVALAMMDRNNGIVNICSGKPISVRKLVEDCIKENGFFIDLNLGYYPYSDYEPMAFWGYADKLFDIINRPHNNESN